jgi:5-methylcytosine-specific restriction protein A
MGMMVWHRHSRAVTRGARWRALRLQALRRDGFRCRSCGERGELEVDHIEPVRARPDLAWSLDNLQALCVSCHTRKTRSELGLAPSNPDRVKWNKAVRQLERDGHPQLLQEDRAYA